MKKVTLGGDRLGAGKRMKVELKSYERSTHNLSYVNRFTASAGTLIPFLSKPMTPGSTWDIELDCDVKTHPTIGPLFGHYKVQLDVFKIPVRLYNGKMHANMTKIGLDMSKIKIPQLEMKANANWSLDTIKKGQINSSCLYHYLGMKGLGIIETAS